MNPKEHLELLHVIRKGMTLGILSKDEVIAWADSIIVSEEKPDLFFLDLTLLANQPSNRVIMHFSEYLNFETPEVWGNPLLGMMYKAYNGGQKSLHEVTEIMSDISFYVRFSHNESYYLHEYGCALEYLNEQLLYKTIDEFEVELKKFLSIYKDYTIYNYSEWKYIDTLIKGRLEVFEQEEMQLKLEFVRGKKKNAFGMDMLTSLFRRKR